MEAAHQLMYAASIQRWRSTMLYIVERNLLGSPLVAVGKSLKLSRNRLVRDGFGGAKQSPRGLQKFVASLRDLKSHEALARFSGDWSKATWNQPIQLWSLWRRALKQSTHFLEQSCVRHE
jgi:hypothetical protein